VGWANDGRTTPDRSDPRHRLAPVSAQAGWYPDPGGGQDLYRYWDGRAWSAATSPNPSSPPPAQGLVPGAGQVPGTPGQPAGGGPVLGQASGAQPHPGSGGYPTYDTATGATTGSAYAHYQQTRGKRSPVGWWLAGAALLVAVVVVAVLGVRVATTGGGASPLPGQGRENSCPDPQLSTATPAPDRPDPADGRVHGGPVSYPALRGPWDAAKPDNRVPFGIDAQTQTVPDQLNYDGLGNSWVASVLVAELQAGDGFFSPEQGAQIVVRCILGTFYGNAAVQSDVQVDEKATIDGHDAWIVESQLSFDIPNLRAKGERLIVAIVSAGATSGLYYASIPDTKPELVAPARRALEQLQVDS
jgi:uncharacterized protein DUF2510